MPTRFSNLFSSAPSGEADWVFLPDHRFFVRPVPVTPEASGDDLVAQVELALEEISPFPVGQLFYGFYRPADSDSALVFAAFRRQFSTEQSASWKDADYVLPAFCAALGAPPPQSAVVLLRTAASLTALVWEADQRIPRAVVSRPLPADASEADAEAVRRDVLVRSEAAGLPVLEWTPEEPSPRREEEAWVFRFASKEPPAPPGSRLDAASAASMDVRDKEQLAARRKEQARNRYLWVGFQAAVLLLVAASLLEIGLMVGGYVLRSRQDLVNSRSAQVQEIRTSADLAQRIEDLGGQQLLPFEMLLAVNEIRPRSIAFTRVATNGLYTLEVQAETVNAVDADNYTSRLRELPTVESVRVRDFATRGGRTVMVLAVTFLPDAFKLRVAAPAEEEPAQSS